MSKWNKWKLIHKETGLTFNQYYQEFGIKTNAGYIYNVDKNHKLVPVLLQSGIPAVYVDQAYYPSMFFLNNKEWEIVVTVASPKVPNIQNSGSGKVR